VSPHLVATPFKKRKEPMRKIHFAFIASLLFILSVSAVAAPLNGIVAFVNDEPITSFDVTKEKDLLEKSLEGRAPLDDAARQQVQKAAIDSLINKKLIEQKIKELDVRVTDEEIRQAIDDVKKNNNLTQERLVEALAARGISYDDYKIQLKDQLERLRLISIEVRSKVQITEKETRDYYDSNPDKFQVEEAFRGRQIFLKLSPKAPESERKRVYALAEKVLSELKGGADFAQLAKKYSQDPSAKDGGDLGFLKKGDVLPEFESALLRLKQGEISGLISTTVGVHILKLEEYRPGKRQTYDQAKQEIEDFLYRKKSEERFNQWLEELRKNASIQIKSAT
jgi:peptidyl-prolyl cis-trans isomerase SurA